MSTRRNKQPVRDHRRHPAFIRVLDGLEDVDTGIRVLKVQYEQTDDFDGGTYVEVYDSNDDLITESFGEYHNLRQALEDAVEDFGEDFGARYASLRKSVIKLAHMNPDLRPHLLPLLKEGFRNQIKGSHIIVRPDGKFSIQDIPKDPHGQVYDAAILIDKRRTIQQAMLLVWKQYRREILAQRSVWKATDFIDEKLQELSTRPLKGYIKWHHYSMPD